MTSLLHLQQYPFLSPPLTKHPACVSVSFTSSKPTSSKLCFFCLDPSNAELAGPTSQNPPETETGSVDRVKLAFEKAEAYRKSLMEKKGAKVDASPRVVVAEVKKKEPKSDSLLEFKALAEMQEKKYDNMGSNEIGQSVRKFDEPPLSKMDFVGLDFGEKKSSRGLPPGLRPIVNSFPGDEMPDVTLIVGDTSKFGNSSSASKPKLDQEDDNSYKPKVSTWGVFPRPANISKTFGGGRSIRPDDELETKEERAAKEKRTRELIAAYKRKIGVVIDPKVRVECEKALMDGDSLMESGNLREALLYYQEVIDKLPFETELHGLAALQWAICQDSLSRRNLARPMYEKLQTHPNPEVNKKASLFVFSFQAMKMLKVTGSDLAPKDLGYQQYFNAFVEEDKMLYPTGEPETQDSGLVQVLPYMILLVSPIIFVLLLSLQRGNVH